VFSQVVSGDGEPLLVMASGAHRVDIELLAHVLGATAIRKAAPQLVRSATDQVIGGVAPTGHPHRVRTVVDETLARYPGCLDRCGYRRFCDVDDVRTAVGGHRRRRDGGSLASRSTFWRDLLALSHPNVSFGD
jgi:hypothetical protein